MYTQIYIKIEEEPAQPWKLIYIRLYLVLQISLIDWYI